MPPSTLQREKPQISAPSLPPGKSVHCSHDDEAKRPNGEVVGNVRLGGVPWPLCVLRLRVPGEPFGRGKPRPSELRVPLCQTFKEGQLAPPDFLTTLQLQ